MAKLIECSACHNLIASNASACPQCGNRDKPISRGAIAFFVLVLLVVMASWLFPSLFYDKVTLDTRPGHAPQQGATRARDARR
jgi:hypothetical protein